MQFFQRLLEITCVRRQDDIAGSERDFERLMARRVAKGRDRHYGPISEQIVLASHLLHQMAMVIVLGVEAVGLDQFRNFPGLPLTLLNDDPCVRHGLIAARVIEVQMRIDEILDTGRIDLQLLQPRLNFLSRSEVNLKGLGEVANATVRVVLAVGMKAGVE